MTIYINRLGQGYRETVSECTSWKQARAEVLEYAQSDPTGHYYLSRRCCANWRD